MRLLGLCPDATAAAGPAVEGEAGAEWIELGSASIQAG